VELVVEVVEFVSFEATPTKEKDSVVAVAGVVVERLFED